MIRFDNSKTKELQEFLYNSCIHDSQLKSVICKQVNDCLEIEVHNQIFNTKMKFVFYDIDLIFAVKGNCYGNRETINSLTIEEDFSFFQKYSQENNQNLKNSLYLLFQMFSGDEIHIVSKKLIVETTK